MSLDPLAPPARPRPAADRAVGRFVVLSADAPGEEPAPPPFDPHTTLLGSVPGRGLGPLVARLVEAGWPPSWPAALMQRVDRADEARTATTLGALVDVHRRLEGVGPLVLVVG